LEIGQVLIPKFPWSTYYILTINIPVIFGGDYFFKALGQLLFLEKLGGFWFFSAGWSKFLFLFLHLLPLFLQNTWYC
jgi:hypothetical protein